MIFKKLFRKSRIVDDDPCDKMFVFILALQTEAAVCGDYPCVK